MEEKITTSTTTTTTEERLDGQKSPVEHLEVVPSVLHHDMVAPEALGLELPANYYFSSRFLGTLVATCLAQVSGYLGWVLPANTISLIVAELGEEEGGDAAGNAIWLAVSWQAGFAVGFLWVGRVSVRGLLSRELG